MTNAAALARVEPDESRALARADDVDEVKELLERFNKIRKVQRAAMVEGIHYGKVPGTDKPALLKPGAEMLCLLFHLDPQFSTKETWDGEHLECVVTCTLYNAQTEKRLGSGIGSCSTKESKYAWRKAERLCPECQKPAIIKGKEEYGGGWVCFKRKNGCGAKFRDGDKAIESQEVGRVPNPDIADMYNTVRKMACKRAHVAASLFVTGGSALFTQDVEENVDNDRPPPIDPHADADGSEPAGDTESFAKLKAQLDDLERRVGACGSYDEALRLRSVIGSKAKPSQLCREMSEARDRLSVPQRRDIGSSWHRIDRKLAKLETGKHALPKPDVSESFADEPEGDGELSPEQERELF